MDRNPYIPLAKVRHCEVALRKESVDRNAIFQHAVMEHFGSLSARRAWIEISRGPRICRSAGVALRKESVDRNRGHDFWPR